MRAKDYAEKLIKEGIPKEKIIKEMIKEFGTPYPCVISIFESWLEKKGVR